MMSKLILLALISIWAKCNAEVELITEPRSGEEYVFVSGGQPQALKQAKNTKDTYFETSHKIPEKLPSHHVSRETENHSSVYTKIKPKIEETEYSPIIDVLKTGHIDSSYNVKRESGEGIIEIEEDKKAVKKDYKKKASGASIKPTDIEIDLPFSKIENIKISEKISNQDTNAGMHVELEPMSQSGKLIENLSFTTQKPILTTVAPTTPKSYDVLSIGHGSPDSINAGLYSDSNLSLEEAGSEQKQTRIEIKKGPNGQDYEYEYVYYYYDDADEVNETSSKKEAEPAPTVYNSHDGPQNTIDANQVKSSSSRSKSKYSTIERSSTTTTSTTQAPESNEVLPGSRTRYRGRNIAAGSSDNEATDERLPANTRFPPRSRTTTPSVHDKVEDDIVEKPTRQKSRTQSADRGSDENVTQSKNRSRSNVRRPSLELVDSASFNTHASDVSVSQYKEIRSRLNSVEDKETEKAQKQGESSRGSSRRKEEPRDIIKPVEEIVDEEVYHPSTVASVDSEEAVTSEQEKETTEFTTMAAMDKVALDLYAYIAGENSKNEINSSELEDDTTAENSEDATTTELATTTEEITTTTTTTTPSTTTTTTTTTTPAPSPSTTVRGSRFRARPGSKAKSSPSSTTTESAPSSPKTRGRFGGNSRPQFGRGRSNNASPSVPEQQEEGTIAKSEVVPVQNAVTPGRSRYGNRSRPTRTSTTAAPAEESPSTEGSVGSRLRNRPTLKLRGGTAKRPSTVSSTTASSSPSDLEPSDVDAEPSSTTPKSVLGRGRLVGNLRPLRPNPRIAIGGRTNLNSANNANNNASTVATSTEGSSTSVSVESKENSGEQVEATTQQPGEVTVGNPLNRLRGRPRLQVAPAPRVKAPQPTAPRRPSPLLARRRQPEPEVSESTPVSNDGATSNEPGESAQDSISTSDETQNSSDVETPSEEPSTEAPKGISSLLQRRRLANRKPGTIL